MRWTVPMLGVLLAGCASWVNIPAENGDAAAHDPNLKTVLKIELQAVRAVNDSIDPVGAPFVILPKDTTAASYEAVVPQVSPKASWSTNAPPAGALVLEVRQVRVRGTYAQADVIRPATKGQPEGPGEVVTVYLHYDMVFGWHVERLRPWRIGVDDALVQSAREAEVDIKP
jgi:hypothetical protein